MTPNETNKQTLTPKTQEIHLSDLVRLVGRNWYWFVLSVLICGCIAIVYIRTQPKIFTRTASVLIYDEKRGGGTESEAFKDVNLISSTSNVSNEVLVFKSKRLMLNVIKELRIDITYKTKGRFQSPELYRRSPIKLFIVDETEAQAERLAFELIVTPVSDQEFLLSDDKDWSITASFNDTITSPYGRICIKPTIYLNKQSRNVPIYVRKNNMRQMANALSNSLRTTIANQFSSIINLTLGDVSIARVEDILNTLVATYNNDINNDKRLIAANTSAFIDERLAIIETELGSVDSDIEDFKKQNKLTDIRSETGMYLQSSSEYQQQWLALENQLAIAKSIRDYLNDQSKRMELIPTNTGVFESGVEKQISDYNEIMLRRSKLDVDASEKNPVVINLNNSLSALRQTISATVDNLIAGLEIRIKNIRARDAQTSRRISEVPTQQKYVLSVERQQKIKESLYLYLLNKREESALSQSIRENSARIIDSANGSNVPISPNTRQIYLIALCFGLIIPIGTLWIVNALDNKVRSQQDVERHTTIPFLGDIPLQDKMTKDPLGDFTTIAANLSLISTEKKKKQVVHITSYYSKEGKSYVASNLAAAFAGYGNKTILLNMDLHAPDTRLHGVSDPTPGIIDYLSGTETRIEELIVKSGKEEGFDMIRVGSGVANIGKILFSQKLDELIHELRNRYDYVVLDSVSSSLYPDAFIMNRLVDLTLYVIRYGQMDDRLLAEIENLHQEAKLNHMQIILNGTKKERMRLLPGDHELTS